MLKIPFSHRYFKMPEGVEDRPTVLLNYAKVNHLSPDFRVYDTEYLARDDDGNVVVGRFDLGRQGPWLILFLRTDSPAGPRYWTTVRRPWRRAKGGDGPIPAKYRGARGKRVRIVISGRFA